MNAIKFLLLDKDSYIKIFNSEKFENQNFAIFGGYVDNIGRRYEKS